MNRFCILALSTALLVACKDKEGDDTGGGDGGGGDPDAGADLYVTYCEVCHGAGGGGEDETGYTGASDLNVEAAALSEAQIVDVILNGEGSMPAVDVTQEEAEDIAAYVKVAFGN